MHAYRARFLLLFLSVLFAGFLPHPAAGQAPDKLDHLVLAGPPGPLSIPLAYLVVNHKLADVADNVELTLWEDQNQLRAILAGQQADFVTLPSNNAAIFYNKGLKLQLLDIAAWDASFGVSADRSITSLRAAAGKRVAIPFEGSIPDLLFQYVATANGLKMTDFAIQYTPNPQQAAQLILGGKADVAILPEPLATAVLLSSANADTPLQRVFSLSAEWAAVTDDASRTPLTGTVALPSVLSQPEVIAAFQREYGLAVQWVVAHPDAAGQLAEEHLAELGLKAKPVALSLQQTTWDDVSAQDARPDIEQFFTRLLTLSPDVIGGKLPDDGFYYDTRKSE